MAKSSSSHFLKQIYRSENDVQALVVADLTGDDLILCQITTQSRHDNYSVALTSGDFEHGRLHLNSFIRPNRLFTVEQSVIVYTAAKVKASKLDEVRSKIRQLFT